MTVIDLPNQNRSGQIKYQTMKDGAKLRTASWTSDNNSKAIVILVHGHREFMEKYNEFSADLLGRNFALYALDNRGQGLSDRLLPDRVKSHADRFDIFSEDLNEFISKTVMADPRANELPIYLIAHSMGGHISLRYLHDFPGVISKAVLMSPMIDFNLGISVVKSLLKKTIRLANFIGFKETLAFGQKAFQSKNSRLIKQKLLTHDKRRYASEAELIQSNPDLYVGGATFGWLKAALDSMREMHQPGYLDDISIPLLVILPEKDKVVDSQASRDLLSGYDNIRITTIKGARHEIYREHDEYRDHLWQEIDAFLTVQ
ncbi:MAG: alpha/beta hydrolase [Emcibacter sp.]|nr:alpha/beta hydrolase [Emcibacter sp.]